MAAVHDEWGGGWYTIVNGKNERGSLVQNFLPRSRFQLNVTAGSQKRAIHECKESEGKDESRFALKMKRNLDLNCKSRWLSIFCHYWDKHCHYWDSQNVWAFSRCVENDSQKTEVPSRPLILKIF
jgi:hypothetical protein